MVQYQTPKLRSACDACHEAKVKCAGGSPCVYCKNRHQNCHYSFAARIGKPKGSRNRKTLARLREAALHATKTQASPLSSSYALIPVQNGVQGGMVPSTPDWACSDCALPIPSIPYLNSSSELGQPAPTPPESIDSGSNNFQLHENSIAYQWQLSTSHFDESQAHFPESPFQFTRVGNQESSQTIQHKDGYISSRSLDDTSCYCFQWQTSNLMSLHDLMTLSGRLHRISFEDSLQKIIDTISACQQIMACQSCIKSPGMMFYLTASLQMALDHFEFIINSEDVSIWFNSSTSSQAIGHFLSTQSGISSALSPCPDAAEENRNARLMQIRHELITAQIALKEIQETFVSGRQIFPIDQAEMGVGIPASSDSDCLIQVAERLQASIENHLTIISSQQSTGEWSANKVESSSAM